MSDKQAWRRRDALACVLAVLMFAAAARADMANIYLKDGTALRGELQVTEAEVIIRTQIGEARYPRAAVDLKRTEWLEPATSPQQEFRRRFMLLDPRDIDGHCALASWALDNNQPALAQEEAAHLVRLAPDDARVRALLEKLDNRTNPTNPPPGNAPATTRPAEVGPPARPVYTGPIGKPPIVSEGDMNRLKLYELPRVGQADRVQVKFERGRSEQDVTEIVEQRLQELGDIPPQELYELRRGKPYEKLQIVLRYSDMEFADRILVRRDPEVFNVFRKQVLPTVMRDCARSGCHGGSDAHLFRLPDGAARADDEAYTAFLILDRVQTAQGPLVNRGDPDNCPLLTYMLPADQTQNPHPAVKDGSFRPALRNKQDRDYAAIRTWLEMLRYPHPDYQLEYVYPPWLPQAAGATKDRQ